MGGSCEGKSPLRELSRRWEECINVYMYPKGKGRGICDWSNLAQNRGQREFVVSTVTNVRVP